MKLFYYPEMDSLYIDLSERASVDSIEVAPGVVVDMDEQGNVVGKSFALHRKGEPPWRITMLV